MKTFNFNLAIILINLFTLSMNAQTKKHRFRTIQISTNVMCNNVQANNYSAILYKDGVKLDSIFNESNETLDVMFQVNQLYSIQIKKPGFEDVIIIINTSLPEGLDRLSKKSLLLGVNMALQQDDEKNYTSDTSVKMLVIDKTLGTLVAKSIRF